MLGLKGLVDTLEVIGPSRPVKVAVQVGLYQVPAGAPEATYKWEDLLPSKPEKRTCQAVKCASALLQVLVVDGGYAAQRIVRETGLASWRASGLLLGVILRDAPFAAVTCVVQACTPALGMPKAAGGVTRAKS